MKLWLTVVALLIGTQASLAYAQEDKENCEQELTNHEGSANPGLVLRSDEIANQAVQLTNVFENIFRELVIKHQILFSRPMVKEFEVAYKQIALGISSSDRVINQVKDFSFRKAAQDFPGLAIETQRKIASNILEQVVKRHGVHSVDDKTDAYFVQLSAKLKVSTQEAIARYKLLDFYERNPELREYLVRFLVAGLPSFAKIGSAYTYAWQSQVGFTDTYYLKDNLWKMISQPVSMIIAGLGPPFLESTGLLVTDGWLRAGIFAAVTAGAVGGQTLALHAFQRPLQLLRLRQISQQLGRGLDSSQVPVEGSYLETYQFGDSQYPTSRTSFREEIHKMQISLLDPDDQHYRDTKFGDFGESAIGERNLLASGQIFVLRGLIEQQSPLVDMGGFIRQKLSNGGSAELSKVSLIRQIQTLISNRKKILVDIRTDIGEIESYLRETNVAIDKFLAYGEGREMEKQRKISGSIERNIATQLLGLREQKATAAILGAALESLNQFTSAEAEALSRATNSLVLINLNPGSAEALESWKLLADLFSAPAD